MQVGVTTLKKVCRMHNIKRWPYRRRSYIHKLTRKAGSGDGRVTANERAAERAREASGALGPAAPPGPVSTLTAIPAAGSCTLQMLLSFISLADAASGRPEPSGIPVLTESLRAQLTGRWLQSASMPCARHRAAAPFAELAGCLPTQKCPSCG